MKIRSVGAELFHVDGRTDRQTDMTKLTVAFRSCANAPNNWRSKKSSTLSSRYITQSKFIETHSDISVQAIMFDIIRVAYNGT
jgi:hypothetical protein